MSSITKRIYSVKFCWRFTVGLFAYRQRIKNSALIVFTSFVLMPGLLAVASESELAPKVNLSKSDMNHSIPIKLSVRGASAGITVDYYEQAVVDAINASELFSSNDEQHYSLDIRIVKVDTPSFSEHMTVSMKAVWKFYCTEEKIPLLEKKIISTYTGGLFEGGIIGANRVRVAMEGAARESVHAGMELIASLDLEQ